MQHLVGISGKKQHGKDTVARMLQWLSDSAEDGIAFPLDDYLDPKRNSNSFGKSVYQTRQFAEKLKQIVAMLIGCSREDLENEEFKNIPLGPEWDRWVAYHHAVLEDVWMRMGVYTSYEEAKGKSYRADKIVREQLTPRIMLQEIGTEGLRGVHPNIHINATFADFTVMKNWIITDVRFPNEIERIKELGGVVIRVRDPRKTAKDEHLSETALDNYINWDAIIVNNSDIKQLLHNVDFVYNTLIV